MSAAFNAYSFKKLIFVYLSVLLKPLKIPLDVRSDINKKPVSLIWTPKALLTNQRAKITHWNQKRPSHTKICVQQQWNY